MITHKLEYVFVSLEQLENQRKNLFCPIFIFPDVISKAKMKSEEGIMKMKHWLRLVATRVTPSDA